MFLNKFWGICTVWFLLCGFLQYSSYWKWAEQRAADIPKQIIFYSKTLFTLVHETEAETTRDPTALNFERQDGSFYQIVVQKEALNCIQVYVPQKSMVPQNIHGN